MKILLAGGAGYIGSHATHQLIEAGHQVVVLDNLYSGHAWALPRDAELVRGDVGDRTLVDALLGAVRFDAVMHFAAHIEVGESVQNPAKYYRNNTASTLSLFDACNAAGISKIIFSSTAAVYGEPEAPMIDETQPIRPINPYGTSKAMSEKILQDLANAPGSSLRYVILRYFNVAGARLDGKVGQATPRATHLIKRAAETAIGLHKEMAIFGTDYPTPDGTGARDYIHVEDLVRAHLDALAYLDEGGASEVFNVGYGRSYSVREVIETMGRVSGRALVVVEQPRRPGDPSALVADNRKIRRLLGWNARYDDLELICRTSFEWEKRLQSLRRERFQMLE